MTDKDDLGSKWTHNAQQQLRADVLNALEADNLSQKRAAREIGCAESTWSAWFKDSYTGTPAKAADLAEKTASWLAARREKASLARVLPPAPSYQETATARKIWSLLQFCHHAPDFGVIAMGPGVGKTTTIEAYKAAANNVFVVTAEPIMASPRAVLAELAEVTGVVERVANRRSEALQRRLRGSGALIVIDEAQHLTTTALDQLRALHDKAGVGLVLSGNQTVYSRIAGEGGKAQFAQLYSRVGMRLTRERPLEDDITVMASALGVSGAKELNLLRLIGRKPGALRGVVKTVRLARVIATGDDEHLAERHMKEAWAQIGAQALEAA